MLKRRTDDGFTLIELLVVMIIIGILAAIAIPVFLNQQKKANDTATKSDISIIGKQIAAFYVDGDAALSFTGSPGYVTVARGADTFDVKLSQGTNIDLGATYAAGAQDWCVQGTNDLGSGTVFSYSSDFGMLPQAC